jgi:uncharacterized membrane protein YgdD (TMEM256/DUF423 family)
LDLLAAGRGVPVDRVLFTVGAALGFLGVAAGAFGAHALKNRFAERSDRGAGWQTAAQYQMVHAVALLATSWAAKGWGGTATAAGWLFAAGIALFSGSLYLLAFTGERRFGAIAPVGGVCLLLGWLLLMLAAASG